MPSEDTKILQSNQNQKSDKTPSTIYGVLEYLMKKYIKNNPEKLFTTKVGQHIPSVFQCLQYRHLMAYKISTMYAVVKFA